jgi:uncharacterized protein YutE (UPF0331/DUF86 family)
VTTLDDIVLGKTAALEQSLRRIGEEYRGEPAALFQDLTRQDSILLNLQRACENAIDLAMHLVRRKRLGVPKSSRDAFEILGRNGVIPLDVATSLMRMVGFRTVAVHEYQTLNLEVVRHIIETRLDDFRRFADAA